MSRAAIAGARMCSCGQGALSAGVAGDLCSRCLRGRPVPDAVTRRSTVPGAVTRRATVPESAMGYPGLHAARRAAQIQAFTPPPPTEHEWTLERLGEPALQLLVHGRPTPQGSKYAFINKAGRAQMAEETDRGEAKHLTTWRSAVEVAAIAVKPAGWVALDGAVCMDLVYTFTRPKDRPKTLRVFPITRATGDFEKLDRATNDALKDAGVLEDDSIVIAHRHHAAYYAGDPAPDVLPAGEQGAVIRLWRVPVVKL